VTVKDASEDDLVTSELCPRLSRACLCVSWLSCLI